MEKKLYDACLKGEVETLEALMREDELTLARVSISSCFNDTPLHVVSMLGHFEFAKSLLSYKPDFASRLDLHDRSPLHLASANGYANIVKLLLEHDQEMCRVRDEDGKTPLHLAVMNGQHESVIELIKVKSESYDEEGTVLHLCVMYNRLNLLIRLLELNYQDLLNIKDGNGDTILHVATALRRIQIIKYLVTSRRRVDVNSVNVNGLTALDMIKDMPKDVKTNEIKKILVSAKEMNEAATTTNLPTPRVGFKSVITESNIKYWVKKWKKLKNFSIFQEKKEKIDETLLVAATVIAAMAYQAAISPPGGVAGMDASKKSVKSNKYDLQPGESFLAYFDTDLSNEFWISNTISFMASLSVTFLYISGATLKRRIFIWFIRAAMWISLTSMVGAYTCAVQATNPGYKYNHILVALFIGQYIWMGLIFLSFLVLVFRSVRFMGRKKRVTKKKKGAAEFFRTPNANIV